MKKLIIATLVTVAIIGSVFAIKALVAENAREMHMGGTNVYLTFQGTTR